MFAPPLPRQGARAPAAVGREACANDHPDAPSAGRAVTPIRSDMRPRALASVALAVALASVAAACGSEGAQPAEQPGTVIRPESGQLGPSGPCDSWLGVGVAAAYCANGHEAPAPNAGGQTLGELRFTGLKRSAASEGISQGVGTLSEGETIGVQVRGETTGTLLAQGICEGMKIKAAFYDQRFVDGAEGTISIHRADEVPVILLTLNHETIAPDREVVWNLPWLPAEAKELCAFAVQ